MLRLHTLINSDPTQTTRHLADQLDTSHSTVERHLHDQGMEFRDGRWAYVGNNHNFVDNSPSSSNRNQQTFNSISNNAFYNHSDPTVPDQAC